MRAHDRPWPAYAIETAGLACFMAAAVAVTVAIEHPASPIRAVVGLPLARRALTGAAMGLTAATLIYSPWGRRSGGHFNPAVTLGYFHLQKIAALDTTLYLVAQFIGAIAGVAAAAVLLGGAAADAAVNYAATVPGPSGPAAAFAGETLMSFGMMTAILTVSNTPRLARFTGIVAACLVAIYITVEAPISGMSMNPARSLAPALPAHAVRFLWIYFLAPPIGMLAAADLYARRHGRDAVQCAKLHHPRGGTCHFNCGKAA